MSHVFPRAAGLPRAVRGEGVWITDEAGCRYLDAAGGAVVVGIGHGVQRVVDAIAEQAAALAYVHGTAFTTAALEDYAAALAAVVPVHDARVYPVAGGSEAMETAFKLTRAYHLARGEPRRHRIVGRSLAYHGNTRAALDASDRPPLQAPYEPWLGQALRVPAATEYRCPFPDSHPDGCAARHAEALERTILVAGPETVAAFVAEPIGGAASGAAVPPDGYWPAVADVCRRHGVLLIADEVMTGFGRTGRWFASEHFGLDPDLLVAAKGAASGYWPLGLVVASGAVHDAVGDGGFVHGLTYSHHAVGAAAGHAVLRELTERDLVAAAARQGHRLLDGLRVRLAGSAIVGDVRGRGLLVAVELVADPGTKAPFPRSARIAERIDAAARDAGLLVYPSVGCAGGSAGDLVLLGPPLTVTDAEVDLILDGTATAVDRIAREVVSGG